MKLEVLSGGAAQGLVAALAPQFKAETGCDIAGTLRRRRGHARQAPGRRAGRPADPDLGADRGADAVRPCGCRLRRRHRRRAHGRGRAEPAIRCRRSAMRRGCAPPCWRRTPSTSRPEAGDRRHPFRQGARCARHRARCGRAPAALSQRRHRHAGSGASAGRAPDRLHPGHRDPQHSGRDAGRLRCPSSSSSRPSTRRRVHTRRVAREASGSRPCSAAMPRAPSARRPGSSRPHERRSRRVRRIRQLIGPRFGLGCGSLWHERNHRRVLGQEEETMKSLLQFATIPGVTAVCGPPPRRISTMRRSPRNGRPPSGVPTTRSARPTARRRSWC